MTVSRTLRWLWPQGWKARLVRVVLLVAVAALAGILARPQPAIRTARPPPAPRLALPGDADADRIESIYYERGPRAALAALTQDYADGVAGPAEGPQQRKLADEIARLEAHASRYAQFSPLVGIATQWCLEQHGPGDFPLRYDFLLPARDAAPGTGKAEVALDNEMAKILQINWIRYANVTRSETRGYVADEHQITIKSRSDLLLDQSEQESVRAAAQSLRTKS